MFERKYLRWLREQSRPFPQVTLGIGDDAAILTRYSEQTVITSDLLVDQVHFSVGTTNLELIGRKAIAVSLSDIAAMGAIPLAAVINLCLPKSFSLEDAQRLHHGATKIANEFNCPIVGGDTNRWDQGLVIGSTIVGKLASRGWRIDGAKFGDRIIVTGSLGGSILGKHLVFEPRCRIAEYLATKYDIRAATDISDSLTVDLNEMASRSNVGAEVFPEMIPISDDARRLAGTNATDPLTPLEHAMYDGEDFELLLAADPEQTELMLCDPNLNGSLFEIGRFVAQRGIFLVDSQGAATQIEPRGYEH